MVGTTTGLTGGGLKSRGLLPLQCWIDLPKALEVKRPTKPVKQMEIPEIFSNQSYREHQRLKINMLDAKTPVRSRIFIWAVAPLPFSNAASSNDPIREGAGGMKAGLEPISPTTLRATDSILITNFPFLESSPPNEPSDWFVVFAVRRAYVPCVHSITCTFHDHYAELDRLDRAIRLTTCPDEVEIEVALVFFESSVSWRKLSKIVTDLMIKWIINIRHFVILESIQQFNLRWP